MFTDPMSEAPPPPAGPGREHPVCVTGASGFIGRRLVPALEAGGYRVRALSRRPAGGQWPTPPAATTSAWAEAVAGVSAVIHLAAIAHQPAPNGDAAARRAGRHRLRAANVLMTAALAEAAARAGAATFIFISSIKAVGEASTGDADLDETSPARPGDCYGAAKLAAERRLHRLAKTTAMRILVVRPPLVFGPGVKANFARLLSLATWSGRGLPLPLARIDNRRSLVYVDNLVSALVRIIDCEGLSPATRQGEVATYHLADEPALSTPELIQRIAAARQQRASLFPLSPAWLGQVASFAGRQAEFSRLAGSLAVNGSRFRRDFDWTPPWSLDEGLAATVGSRP